MVFKPMGELNNIFWLLCLAFVKKFELFIPWWLDNRVYLQGHFRIGTR